MVKRLTLVLSRNPKLVFLFSDIRLVSTFVQRAGQSRPLGNYHM